MSEKEAIEYLSTRYLEVGSIINPPKEECEKHNAIVDMAIQALEKQSMVNELMHEMTELQDELEEYKEIGTVKELARLRSDYERVLKYNDDQGEIIDSYEAIGTLDECREAVERMKPKKPYEGSFGVLRCSCCDEKVGQKVTRVLKKDCMNFCAYCGSKVDWSE